MHEQLAIQLHMVSALMHEPAYSGRNMTAPCHAVVGTETEFLEAITYLADDLIHKALQCSTEEEKTELLSYYESLRFNSIPSVRTDNLGVENIYY